MVRALQCLDELVVEGSKLVVRVDMETEKIIEAQKVYNQHQERLFKAFPHMAGSQPTGPTPQEQQENEEYDKVCKDFRLS